jgi:hypothetical protein
MAGGRESVADHRKEFRLRPQHPFRTVRFRARVRHRIIPPIQADDEHRPSMAVAHGLIRSEYGSISAARRGIADALAKTAMTELVGAAKKLNRVIGIVWSQSRLHGAEMLIAEWKNVRPHGDASLTPGSNHGMSECQIPPSASHLPDERAPRYYLRTRSAARSLVTESHHFPLRYPANE